MPEKPKYTRNPDDQCDESCSICLRHFTSKKQLSKHLAFHDSRHDVKAPMNCPACGMECTKATLNNHYREHHNAGKSPVISTFDYGKNGSHRDAAFNLFTILGVKTIILVMLLKGFDAQA